MKSVQDDPNLTDRVTAAGNPNLMAQISASLGLPSDTFLGADTAANVHFHMIEDTAELFRLFAKIDDRQVRLRCIASVRAASDGRDPATAFADIIPV